MTNVLVQVNIKRVADIDTIKQRFYVEIVYKLEWKASDEDIESYNHFKQEQESKSIDASTEWKPKWIPKISFPNSLGAEIQHKSGTPIFFSIKKGKIIYNFEVRSHFMELFELWNFPFDCQDFTIKMKMGNPPGTKENHFLPSSSAKSFAKIELANCVFTDWNVYPLVAEFGFTDPILSKSGHSFPLFIIRLKAQRKYRYYLLRICTVLSALSLASLLSFSVDLDEKGDRFSIDFTLLLTIIAFQYVVTKDLPNLSFLTAIDIFMNMSIGFVLIVTMEHAFIKNTNFWQKFDDLFPYFMLAFWCTWHIITAIYWPYLIKKEMKKLTMGTTELEHYQETEGTEVEVFKVKYDETLKPKILKDMWVKSLSE